MSAEIDATKAADHGARAHRWLGHPRWYQSEALRIFALNTGRPVLPWAYITTACDTPMCLESTCMTLHAPKRLAYPDGVCVYCGMPAGTKDHLLPLPSTGLALRHVVLVVPACADCNSRINDFPLPNIGARRRHAQESIQKRHRTLLSSKHKTATDLREMGPALRSVAVKNNRRRQVIQSRLRWPEDPLYDIKAFQRAGIEDPVAIGMCEATATGVILGDSA